MKKRLTQLVALGGTTAALTLGLSGVANANSNPHCQGTSYAARCVEITGHSVNSTVVETVPLTNNSSNSVDMNCSFSRSLSESLTTSASLSASVEASILMAASASVSVETSESISQTATSATSAGGTITLAPGQSVQCQRTYNSVTANVTVSEHTGTGTTTTRGTATLPSSFGVTIID